MQCRHPSKIEIGHAVLLDGSASSRPYVICKVCLEPVNPPTGRHMVVPRQGGLAA